jgi:acetyl esterase
MQATRKITEESIRAAAADSTVAGLVGQRFGQRPARGVRPLLLFLHGGAFLGGGAQNIASLAGRLAEMGTVVQTLSYPVAQPFPMAFDALSLALAWMAAQRRELAGKGAPLYIAGIEAGANLAAGLALRARDEPEAALAGQILIAPMLDPRLGSHAMRKAEQGAANCDLARGWQKYLGESRNAEHPYAVPMAASRLAGVAPGLIVTVQGDPLRDDGLSYAKRLRAAGVPATEFLLPAQPDPNTLSSRLLIERVRLFLASTAPDAVA